jgi:5-formyltetrahydrofolate cyclo-ligase
MKSVSSKNELRKRLLKDRLAMAPALVKQWSERVQAHFLGSQGYCDAGCIGFYAAFDNEVDTRTAFERARSDGKITAFPKVTGPGEMVYLEERLYEKMQPNQWGILEPADGRQQVAISDLDLVVVPGVGFDRSGLRLGFGGGFYDRLLERVKPETVTVGFGYSFQVLDKIPKAGHDRKVKRVVTEQGFLKMRP